MKILAISYLFPNAVFPTYGIFVLNRLKAVARHAEVKVINPIPWFPAYPLFERYRDYKRIPEREVIDGIEVFHPRFLSIPRILKGIDCRSYVAAVSRVARTLKDPYPFDLVDLHWTFPDLPAGYRVARAKNVPLLLTLRGVEALHAQDGDVREKIVREYLSRVDGLIGLSRQLLERAVRSGAKEPGWVIRNGVDTDTFHHLPMIQARQVLGLPAGQTLILAVGSLIQVKGFDLLIRTLPHLRQRFGTSLKVCIVGGTGHAGDWEKALRSEVEHLGLSDHVAFIGPKSNDQLLLWYNAANVFCLPSRSEGSPNVLTEALACGCPSVATDVGAVREIMECEPGQGECVPPENVDALAEALEHVLANTYARETIAAAMKKYDWDWCARQVLDVYEQVVRTHRNRGGQDA